MPSKPTTRWPILVGAVIAGLSTSLLLAVLYGVSIARPVVAFAVIGVFVGVSAMIQSLWDWWKAR